MKNLTRRGGRIQGRHEKGSSHQEVVVGQRRLYRQPLRRQGTFYEKWPQVEEGPFKYGIYSEVLMSRIFIEKCFTHTMPCHLRLSDSQKSAT